MNKKRHTLACSTRLVITPLVLIWVKINSMGYTKPPKAKKFLRQPLEYYQDQNPGSERVHFDKFLYVFFDIVIECTNVILQAYFFKNFSFNSNRNIPTRLYRSLITGYLWNLFTHVYISQHRLFSTDFFMSWFCTSRMVWN